MERGHLAIGCSSGLLISGDIDCKLENHELLSAKFDVCQGERRHISIIRVEPGIPGEGAFLRRYSATNDGLDGREGAFLPCTFWLVNCLARQGRPKDAHDLFTDDLSAGNDLGLFSEEFDNVHGEMLGKFPQALTHLSLITAIVSLSEMDGR